MFIVRNEKQTYINEKDAYYEIELLRIGMQSQRTRNDIENFEVVMMKIDGRVYAKSSRKIEMKQEE